MVVRNKIYRVIDAYRSLLKTREKQILASNPSRYRYLSHVRAGNKTKNRILNFYQSNDRWPSRLSDKIKEHNLGMKFENFISKQSLSYDPQFRRLALATGRKTNNKRKHDVAGFKKQIVEFIKEYGRAPSTPSGATITGEGTLRSKLDYYTKEMNDMTFLGVIYSLDKCHRSGIPMKFREIINQQIDVEKPLIRLV